MTLLSGRGRPPFCVDNNQLCVGRLKLLGAAVLTWWGQGFDGIHRLTL